MLETKFFVAGSNQEEALKHTCELACKLFFKQRNLPVVENIDIICDTALEAESLDKLLWSYPKDALIPHKLAHKDNQEVFAEIGYPGIKFTYKDNKGLINLSPDLPNRTSDYLFYFQLVIKDNSSLRERAATTWSECKSMGLQPIFVEDKLNGKEF